MAISDQCVDAHILRWSTYLGKTAYPHREKWPGCLFHHAPLTNATLILEAGAVKSRNDVAGQGGVDVAAPGVIGTRDDAYPFSRFYFRPRNPTQFNIEGIRKEEDCRFGVHAPILIIFVFDSKKILTRPGTRFCDRNVQLGAAVISETDAEFGAIPFDKVYHEGPYQDLSIKDHRCAEVLAASPLSLDDHLLFVCCRSDAERDTLLSSLNWKTREKWKSKVIVSDGLRVFEKRYPFVQDVNLSAKGVTIRINPRYDRRNIELRIEAFLNGNDRKINFFNDDIAATPSSGGRWYVKADLEDGFYNVVVHIDGHLAYSHEHLIGDVVF